MISLYIEKWIPSPLEGTQILEEGQSGHMIKPLEMKDPNWILKEKLKYEAIWTSEDDLVGEKYVLLSMFHALCSRKTPRI